MLQYARYREQITPEGHRAPLADLLRATRSVNTQTPATDLPSSSYSSGNCSFASILLSDQRYTIVANVLTYIIAKNFYIKVASTF